VLVDERLNVKYANGAAAILLRAKRDGMTGVSIEQFIHDPTLREGIRSVADGSVRHRTTIELKRQESEGGGVLRFNLRAVRKDDASASVVITIEDVTQQRVADEARNSFVAQATHELRTPLTNIRLYVEEAIDVGDGDPTKRAKCLDVINHECRRLERIVGDMLSVSEIEAGSFKLRSGDVRLDTVFEELRSDFEAQAKEKHLELKFDLPPKLPAIKGAQVHPVGGQG
jgi:signal transduction histidine kinase